MRDITIGITMGDPKGVGPEVICKALSQVRFKAKTRIVVIGWQPVFEQVLQFKQIQTKKNISFIDICQNVKNFPKKNIEKFCGELCFLALQKACDLIRSKEIDAIVTAPISKYNIQKTGFKFPGHTEYFCHEFKVKQHAMMLFHDKMRVVLTTIHLPLRKVFKEITPNNIIQKLELTSIALTNLFGIKKPQIAVCGLNPHAGEQGVLGGEEKTVIEPAIKKFRKNKKYSHVHVTNPLSADSVFHEVLHGAYDAVLCQYHDQGLIPLKTTGFRSSVNLTLGLPFVRTSPGHGTAFDIAGQGRADARSMRAAILAAEKFIRG